MTDRDTPRPDSDDHVDHDPLERFRMSTTPLAAPPGTWARVVDEARRRRNRRRGTAAAAVAAAVVAGVAVAPVLVLSDDPEPGQVAGPSGSGASADLCGPEDVEVSLAPLDAMASTRSLTVRLNSTGAGGCRLGAQPSARLLGADGELLDTPSRPIERTDSGGPAVDRLPDGSGVSLVVSWRVVPLTPDADPDTDCISASGLGLDLAGTGTGPEGLVEVPEALTACVGGEVGVTQFEPSAR